QVTIIVPKRSNHRITDLARSHYIRELLEAGAQVQLYTAGMMHGKVLLADGKFAMTGSANIDQRSLFVNYELGAFFYTQSDIDEVRIWIQDLLNHSEAYQKLYPEPPSLAREVAEDLSRLLTPLL
ncbi:MAG: phospholipase D-like domain-containing protein, partial [Verrucomicrobiota bacterium]